MTFTEKANRSRTAVVVLLIALIACYGYNHIVTGIDIGFRMVISIVPLAIFLPGIQKRQYRSASLLCFVLLLYFMATVQNLFTPGETISESIAMTIIVLLFVVAMFYSRWQQRADILEADIKI